MGGFFSPREALVQIIPGVFSGVYSIRKNECYLGECNERKLHKACRVILRIDDRKRSEPGLDVRFGMGRRLRLENSNSRKLSWNLMVLRIFKQLPCKTLSIIFWASGSPFLSKYDEDSMRVVQLHRA